MYDDLSRVVYSDESIFGMHALKKCNSCKKEGPPTSVVLQTMAKPQNQWQGCETWGSESMPLENFYILEPFCSHLRHCGS